MKPCPGCDELCAGCSGAPDPVREEAHARVIEVLTAGLDLRWGGNANWAAKLVEQIEAAGLRVLDVHEVARLDRLAEMVTAWHRDGAWPRPGLLEAVDEYLRGAGK